MPPVSRIVAQRLSSKLSLAVWRPRLLRPDHVQQLRPLFPYLRKYRTTFLIGALCVLFNNGVWILFPLVIRRAIDDLNRGVTRHKLADLLAAAAGGRRHQGNLPVPDALDPDRRLARD